MALTLCYLLASICKTRKVTVSNPITLRPFCLPPGFSLLRHNKYDEDELEYFVDVRTLSKKGVKETEGIRDSTRGSGSVDSMADAAKPSDLSSWDLGSMAGTAVETGKDKVPSL